MHKNLLIAFASGSLVLGTVLASPPPVQGTPGEVVSTYNAIADSILAVKSAEDHFVRAMLDGHRMAAEGYYKAGDYQKAAAEMALFANEGDNAIAGVRKRLLDGGHHHHADDEAKGIYEPGYVVVTKDAKVKALAASAAMRQAGDDAARMKAWQAFVTVSDGLLHGK